MTPFKFLSLELLLDGGAALLLLLVPKLVVRILGWPPVEMTFWPRLLGAVLAGLALATAVTLAEWPRPGLGSGFGLAGHITVNLTVAFALSAMLYIGREMPTHRGWLFTALLAAGLGLLALVEIAFL